MVPCFIPTLCTFKVWEIMAIPFTVFLNHSLALSPFPESAEKKMKMEEIKELNLCEATFSDLTYDENFRAKGINPPFYLPTSARNFYFDKLSIISSVVLICHRAPLTRA